MRGVLREGGTCNEDRSDLAVAVRSIDRPILLEQNMKLRTFVKSPTIMVEIY